MSNMTTSSCRSSSLKASQNKRLQYFAGGTQILSIAFMFEDKNNNFSHLSSEKMYLKVINYNKISKYVGVIS